MEAASAAPPGRGGGKALDWSRRKSPSTRMQQQQQQQPVFKAYACKTRPKSRPHALNLLILLVYSSVFSLLMFRKSCNLHSYIAHDDSSADIASALLTDSWSWCPSRQKTLLHLGRDKRRPITFSEILWKRAHSREVSAGDVEELRAASDVFDTSDTRLYQVMKLVKEYLEPWSPVPGIPEGFGSRGGWDVNRTRQAATFTNLMTCCMHVRIVDGSVYFRYGRFLLQPYRVNRANDFVTFLQSTLDRYKLSALRTEFLFNTCDHPLSASAFMFGGSSRANYMVWSNHFAEGHSDLLVPDFLDLGPEYMPSRNASEAAAPELDWEDKNATLVFRGSTTNFNIHAHNWVSSPRLRLHRMSDAYPDLMDARISRWSHVLDFEMRHEMRREGIVAAQPIKFSLKDAFKFELVMDGGLGTTRPCGVLMNNRVLVRQGSPFYQFFDPLFVPGRHFVPVNHNLDDLAEKVAYMKSHDREMKQMAANARQELGWTCTEEGRMLAFAVLLVKHESLVKNTAVPEQVHKPTNMCQWGALKQPLDDLPNDGALDCMDRDESPILELPGCPTFCSAFGVHEKDWRWLTFEDVVNAQLAS